MTKPRGDLQLAVGYWIVSHRDQLRKWWVLVLLGFISLTLVWAIGFFVYFYARQPATDAAVATVASRVADLQVPSTALPQAAEIEGVSAVSRGNGRIDLVAFLRNVNVDWGAPTATGHFTVNGTAMESQSFFLNPGQERPVVQTNLVAELGGGELAFVIDEIQWERAAAAALPSTVFAASDLRLTQTTVTLGGRTFLTYNVQVSISNRSVFNFLRVEVPLILRSGSQVVAIEQLTLDRWPTLTDKVVNFSWSYPVAQADRAMIEPVVSQFDADNLYR